MPGSLTRVACSWPDRLVGHFEGLGDRCDIGIMQNLAGANMLGLLRFAAIPLEHLVDGIRTRFAQLDDPALLSVFTRDGENEWIGSIPAMGIVYHTGTIRSEMDEPHVLARERRRIKFLTRKFSGVLDDPYKTFVRQEDGRGLAEILRLHTALQAHGPHSLLWISLAGNPDQVGWVEQIRPGLCVGYYGADWRATLLTPRGLAVWLHLFIAALRILKPVYFSALEREPELMGAKSSTSGAWLCASGTIAGFPPPVDTRFNARDVMRHVVRDSHAGSPDTFMSCDLYDLEPNRLYVASAWVSVAEGFTGWIAMAFSGLAPLQMWPVTVSALEDWQRVVTSFRTPALPGAIRVGLLAMADTGVLFLSTGWRVEPGVTPSDYFDGLPC